MHDQLLLLFVYKGYMYLFVDVDVGVVVDAIVREIGLIFLISFS